MRVVLPILGGLLLALPAAAAGGDARLASVRVVECDTAAVAEERSATFEARARAIRGSAQIRLRFTVEMRDDDVGGWRRVVAPGLEGWLTSDPGVQRYSYARTVENLSAPAAYRTVVQVRWLDGRGDVLRSTRVTSGACRQQDLQPNLDVPAVRVAGRADGTTRRYVVRVRNRGRAAAGPFDVGLRVGDFELAPVPVAGLEPRDGGALEFIGPACEPGAPLTATADAGDAVTESDEDDNVLSTTCP